MVVLYGCTKNGLGGLFKTSFGDKGQKGGIKTKEPFPDQLRLSPGSGRGPFLKDIVLQDRFVEFLFI